MSVRNTNHYGIAGYYAMEAAKEDMIGISMTNTTPLVAPANGVERMLGTNPIAVAVPANKQPPMVCDMATSTVAYGKVSSEQTRDATQLWLWFTHVYKLQIEIANRLGTPMPLGWALDKAGQPTQSPSEMMDGGVMLALGSDAKRSVHKVRLGVTVASYFLLLTPARLLLPYACRVIACLLGWMSCVPSCQAPTGDLTRRRLLFAKVLQLAMTRCDAYFGFGVHLVGCRPRAPPSVTLAMLSLWA